MTKGYAWRDDDGSIVGNVPPPAPPAPEPDQEPTVEEDNS